MNHGLYEVGDLVRTSVQFKDAAGSLLDPDNVYLKVQNAAGTETSVTPTHDSTGKYHYDISATAPGRWYYRWYSTGVGQAADEGSFVVKESKFSV